MKNWFEDEFLEIPRAAVNGRAITDEKELENLFAFIASEERKAIEDAKRDQTPETVPMTEAERKAKREAFEKLSKAERLKMYGNISFPVWMYERPAFESNFDAIVKAFEEEPDNPLYIYALAFVIVRSVLKKLKASTGNPSGKVPTWQESPHGIKQTSGTQYTVIKLALEVFLYQRTIESQYYNAAFVGTWKKNGNYESANTPDFFALVNGNDGAALVNEACKELVLLANTLPHVKHWIDTSISVEKLKRRTYKSGNIKTETEVVDVKPLQLVFRAVRKCISDNGSVKTSPDGYSYVLHHVKVNGEEEAVYTRTKNENITSIVDETVYNEFLDTVKLSDMERRIFAYLFAGYGIIEIANILHVSKSRIEGARERIAQKFLAVNPDKKRTSETPSNAPKAIVSWEIDENGKAVNPVYYESIEQAARKTGTNAGSIRAVLKGKRTLANGKAWKRDTDRKPVFEAIPHEEENTVSYADVIMTDARNKKPLEKNADYYKRTVKPFETEAGTMTEEKAVEIMHGMMRNDTARDIRRTVHGKRMTAEEIKKALATMDKNA